MISEKHRDFYLGKVLFGYPKGPDLANLQRSRRIGDVCALDEHPFQDGHIFRRNGDVLGTDRFHRGSFSFFVLIKVVIIINQCQDKQGLILDSLTSNQCTHRSNRISENADKLVEMHEML